MSPRESSNVGYAEPVTTVRSGKRGRPQKVINLEFLQDATNPKRRIALKTLAEKLGMHRNTLHYKLKALGIDNKFSALTDNDLDTLVKVFRQQQPESGLRYLTGFLRKHGLKVQRRRVRAAVNRVDRLGQTLRRRISTKATRQQYKVSRPNALWHIDGHHKLIHWGIVIHGCVDGYSRTVRSHITILLQDV
jgi:Bacterial regulatory protein, Fis family